MSLNTVMDVSRTGMIAQTTRMATTASNMTNAGVAAGSPDEVYKPQYPIFHALQEPGNSALANDMKTGVEVTGIFESQGDPVQQYEPNNPLADENGLVYVPNISYIEEMANMISASRAYQINLEMMNTAKQLIQKTIQMQNE